MLLAAVGASVKLMATERWETREERSTRLPLEVELARRLEAVDPWASDVWSGGTEGRGRVHRDMF